MKNTEITALVTGRYTKAKNARQVYDSKWDALYGMYRFKLGQTVEGRANLYIPYAFSNVETVYPRMVAKRPRMRVLPRGVEDIEAASVMTSLIDYTFDTAKIDETIRRWVKSGLIYGTGVIKVTWKKEIGKVSDIEDSFDADGNMSSKEVTKSKVKYDAPFVSNLDIKSVYADPEGVSEETCKYIIHRYPATRAELEADTNYKKQDVSEVVYGYTNDEIKRGLHTGGEQRQSNEAEVLEYWENDRLIVLAGGVVLRDEPNPYSHKKKPFIFFSDHLDDQVLYGIGEVEPIEGLQNEFNTLRNQRMDFNNLVLNPAFIVEAGAVADLNSIQFKPGWKIVTTKGSGAITPLQMPYVPQSSYKEEESLKADFMTITGVSDYAKGAESIAQNATAQGVSMMQEAANQRFNAKLQNLESGLQILGEYLRDLWLQFGTSEVMVRITDKKGEYSFLKISPSDIQGEFDIKIDAGSSTPNNKVQDRSEELNKYNVLMANPLIQQSPEASLEAIRGLLDKWGDPSAQTIVEALQLKVDEVAKQKQQQEAQAEAQRQAELEVGQEMKGSNGMPSIPDGEEQGNHIPQEFKDMAMQELDQEQAPMMQ